MFKFTIQDPIEYLPKEELYINSIEEVNEYLTKCFPYANRQIESSNSSDYNYSISFCITFHDKVVCGIQIDKLSFHEITNSRVWNGEIPICEIFNTPDAFLIEKRYFEWLENIDEENKDAYRICKKDDKESIDKYNSLNTCCGSLDEEIEINGEIYLFGCNFGH